MTLACLLGPFVFELHFLLILKDPLLISEEMALEHSVLRDPHLEFGFSEDLPLIKKKYQFASFISVYGQDLVKLKDNKAQGLSFRVPQTACAEDFNKISFV